MGTVMQDFRVIPLGVGNAFSARYYTTCMAVGSENSWILIDCPHPIRKILAEGSSAAGLDLDVNAIEFLALSHLHADHASGLEDYGFYHHYVLGRRARVLSSPRVSGKMWQGLLSAGMEESRETPDSSPVRRKLNDFFEVVPLDETRPVCCGSFTVECRLTQHSIPTSAFRITCERTGRKLGYSGDTVFDPTLIDWLSSCHLILHEVTTIDDSNVHTCYKYLAALPAELRSRMRLYHYPDDFDLDGSAIEPLRQGRVYVI